jgi:polysaccharide export outer membrane protein
MLSFTTRKSIHTLVLMGLALLGMGCAGYQPVAAPPLNFAPYEAGAPDQLQVTILPEPVIHEAVTVRPDGMITIQLVGDVPASGRTLHEIAGDIQDRISKFKRGANVTVGLNTAQSSAVTVLGEVRSPGAFALTKHTRVAEAIGNRGGTTPFANYDEIQVVTTRSGEPTVYTIDLGAIRDGDMSTNIQIYGGDIVYVPPTILAKAGYAINAVLFPFQPFLGFGTSAASNALVP